jgi:hypothetical protein
MDINWSPSCRLGRGWRGRLPLYEWAKERRGLLGLQLAHRAPEC